jgi:hypothetical protein
MNIRKSRHQTRTYSPTCAPTPRKWTRSAVQPPPIATTDQPGPLIFWERLQAAPPAISQTPTPTVSETYPNPHSELSPHDWWVDLSWQTTFHDLIGLKSLPLIRPCPRTQTEVLSEGSGMFRWLWAWVSGRWLVVRPGVSLKKLRAQAGLLWLWEAVERLIWSTFVVLVHKSGSRSWSGDDFCGYSCSGRIWRWKCSII